MKKKKTSINKRLVALFIVLFFSFLTALIILNQRSITSYVKSIPSRWEAITTQLINDNFFLRDIRYKYLIKTQSLPPVPPTSKIEIDKKTGWLKYTDKSGGFSFIYPKNWTLETWDNRNPNAWEEKDQNGMSWEWFHNNTDTLHNKDIPLILLKSPSKNTLIIVLIPKNNDNTKLSLRELIKNGVGDTLNDTKVTCPATRNGILRCEPQSTTAIFDTNTDIWKYKINVIGFYSIETRIILSSFLNY